MGFHEAGFEIVSSFDKNSNAVSTFCKNFGDCAHVLDLSKAKLSTFETFKGVNVVIGGPPCQGFSRGGKMDINDPRSQLIFQFLNIIEIVNPQIFVMENVPHLYNSKFRSVLNTYRQQVNDMGYILSEKTINAKDYGTPQSRSRIIFIGRKSHIPAPVFPPVFPNIITSGKILRSLSLPNVGECKAKIIPAKNPILRGSPYSGMLFNGSGRPICLNSVCNTLPASMGGNRTPIVDEKELREGCKNWVEEYYRHLKNGGEVASEIPSRLRRITVTEAKLLQGFPLDFTFCGSISSQYKQIGNSVCPPVSKIIAKTVKDMISTSSH